MPGDCIGSWLRNLEIILHDKTIPEEDWAFILWKKISSEPLQIIESVPNHQLNDYEYQKDQICQNFGLTQLEQRDKFSNLQPKASQTFLDFSAEILVLENWLKVAKVGRDFQKLRELVIKDRILSVLQAKMANFLKCAVLTNLCADLIVENAAGVKEVDERKLESRYRENDFPINVVARRHLAFSKIARVNNQGMPLTSTLITQTQPEIQNPECSEPKNSRLQT